MGRSGKGVDLSGSHLPVLANLLINTKGSVVELGAGYNSTPLLYWYCKANDRYFKSYENYKDWCDKMFGMTEFITDWNALPLEENYWSISFIDLRPALERHRQAIRLRNNAEFVVLHDSEPEIDRFYAYRRVYKYFKYFYNFTSVKPNTLILSNFRDPTQFFT